MKHYCMQIQMYTLAVLSASVSFSNAQVNATAPLRKLNEQKNIANGQPKLIRNHFSNQYQRAADNVHCGLQDKTGNLWFGTTGDGVYRFDGKSFINFTMNDGLDTNQILSILEDKVGNIWFGSRNGVCRYDGKDITKIPITVTSGSSSYNSISIGNNASIKNSVWSMMQDRIGNIWFGTDEGLYCFDGKTFSLFLDNPAIINKSGLTLKSIQCMLEDRNGNIWFGSGPMALEGICFYDGKTLTNYEPKNQQWIRKIVESKNGNILFSMRQEGICYYNPSADQASGKTFNSFPTPAKLFNGSLTTILEDKEGNIWIASDYAKHSGDSLGGAWRSDLSPDNLYETTFTKITSKEVFFMLEDKDNNIWLGTRGTGLYRYTGKTLTNFSE